MALGPVQLLVLGFSHPEFQGEIRDELLRLRDIDLVRVIDVLARAGASLRTSTAPARRCTTCSTATWSRPDSRSGPAPT